jgi:hypothetical protein
MLAWVTAVPGGAGHPGWADAWLYLLLPRSSTVEVAASPPAVCRWSELPVKLHQAPDPGAVGAEVGLDVGGRRPDGGEVDVEQLRAPLQRRRDRPAQVWVVPSPHRTRVSNAVRDPIGNATDRIGRIVGAHWGTDHWSARVNSGQSGHGI